MKEMEPQRLQKIESKDWYPYLFVGLLASISGLGKL